MQTHIQLYPIDLGVTRIHIPVAEIKGNNLGKTLLITAGMDGDEYAGIEAAYELITDLSRYNIPYDCIIIPIINIPGFEAGTSFNPIDRKFPKFTLPNRGDGSVTDRIMNWLYERYVKDSILWIDLHGGAINEDLIPFMSFYAIKNPFLTSLYSRFIQKWNTKDIIIYQKKPAWKTPAFLSKNQIGYILSEAGQRGERDKKYIHIHKNRVMNIIETLVSSMKDSHVRHFEALHTKYRQISIYSAPREGIWHPHVNVGQRCMKNDTVGVIYSYDYQRIAKVKITRDVLILWRKNAMFVTKGEELGGLAL